MTGRPDGVTVEIEWESGTWTDESDSVDWVSGIEMHRGRTDQFSDLQPGYLRLSLRNDSGDYTPDNPLSNHWPNVVEGRVIRVTVTKTSDYRRFLGRISTIRATSLDDGTAAVALEAVDGLGGQVSRRMATDWEEAWRHRAASETCDVFPLDDAPSATSLRNITGAGACRIIDASGSISSFDSDATGQDVLLPGAVSLAPDAGGHGPVLAIDFMRELGEGVLTFGIRCSATIESGGDDITLAEAFDSAGIPRWSVRLSYGSGHTYLTVFDELSPGYISLTALDGADKWLLLSVYDDGSQTLWFVNNGTDGAAYAAPRSVGVRRLILGGRVGSWALLGKQAYGAAMSVAGIAAADTSVGDYFDHARALVTVSSQDRMDELAAFAGVSISYSGSDDPEVTRPPTAGATILDKLSQLLTTIGATAQHDPVADEIAVTTPDDVAPTSSSLTITIGEDDDASVPLQLLRGVDTKPTRSTVSSPYGSATYIDTAAEAAGGYVADPWDSAAPSAAVAYALAGQRVNRNARAGMPQVAIDLVHAQGDLYADAMALALGNRIILDGTPSALVGYTSIDCYVMGWTERYGSADGRATAQMVLDLVAADAPPELVLDGDTSRLGWGDGVATVTGGTAVGTTSTGTIVITTSSGPTLTTDSDSYPLDLDWSGERVTVTSAPASSSSPQTVALTSRGVGATVARSHSSGEPVDVWLDATLAAV